MSARGGFRPADRERGVSPPSGKTQPGRASQQASQVLDRMKYGEGDHKAAAGRDSSAPVENVGGELPSERLLRVHNDMTQVIGAIESLQAENLRLRLKAMKTLRTLFGTLFATDNKVNLKHFFGEWKDHWHMHKQALAVDGAIEETRKKSGLEYESEIQKNLDTHKDAVQTMIEEHNDKMDEIRDAHAQEKMAAAGKLRASISQHEDKMQELQDEHSKNKAALIQQHRESLMAAHQKHIDTQEEFDAVVAKNEREVAELTLENKQLEKKLAKAQANEKKYRQGLKNLQAILGNLDLEQMSTDDLSKSQGDAAGKEKDADEAEYMKDALNEILEQVDPRYLGRSAPA
ncbi:unnamed protein product [Amoebophrya sp. A25]|nr:unnamed protein product [Amoebophrya sp. A25]|eukprot:GSA25T00009791001.1